MATQKKSVDKSMKPGKSNFASPIGNVPIGVKIIAIIYWIGAILGILGGIGMVFGLGGGVGGIPGLGNLGILSGIITIVFGVIAIFIGIGLWKLKSWARIVAIIFAVLGLIQGVMVLFSDVVGGVFNLIINGLIGWYLWFRPEVKIAFGAS